MSYSAVPANCRSDNGDQPGSAFQPPKLQLQDFDFGSPLGGRSRSGSKVKSSIHSGTSYEMVDSGTESNYDGSESGERENQKGMGKESTGNGRNKGDQEHEIAGSGAFVSSHSYHNAEPIQGSNSDGQQQQQAQQQQQYREYDRPTAYGDAGHMHPQITGDPSRLGLQLDDRAGCNERGVSAHTSTAPPGHEYQADNHNDRPHRPGRGRGSSRPQPILPPLPPPPEFLNPHDPQFESSTSPGDIHPVFRHSQSVPELPPVDVQGLHIRDDRDYRPATSASFVGDLFKDFDGVHFDLDNPEAPGFPLRNQQGYPPPPPPVHHQHRQSQAYSDHRQSYIYPDHRYSQVYPDRPSTRLQPPPGLVYYPAPVPAMLNLPPTLSKARPNNRNSRPLAAESMEPAANNNRRSVAYSGPKGDGPSEKDLNRRSIATMDDHNLNNRRSLANLPPALRASQFFDSQLPPIVPDLKEESAVATLDSILDASARAPAAAFTDHPIAGGSALHAHTRNHSTVNNLGNYHNSVAINVKLHPGESPRSSMESVDNPDHHNHNPEYNDDDPGSHLNTEDGEYYDPQRLSGTSDELANGSPDLSQQALPTTLLAELESRKAQQRLRNRTAASAFPRGIRSTLLQLDAVAQVQQEHRRVKKTHLAWEEDPEDEEERDEDVPLGVLFSVAPGVQKRRDDEVPLGLLMKKEMEDAEPLSKRRERLRMVNGQSPTVQPHRMLDVPGLGGSNGDAEDEEVEGETLKERMKRLKEKQQFGTGTLDVDFISSSNKGEQQAEKPEPEETLAQRRRRLQKEKQEEEKHQTLRRESVLLQQEVKSRRSMADLLHARRPQSFYSLHSGANGSYAQLPVHQQHGVVGMNMGMGGYGMGPGLIGRGAGAMGMGPGMMGGEVVLDPKQREVVERWRASVM